MATRMIPVKDLITTPQTGEQINRASEPRHIDLRLLGCQHEAEDVVSFHFEPDRPVVFQAGQYLHYDLPHPGADERGTERYFTISSAPAEPTVMLTTRMTENRSSFKHALAGLKPGMSISATEPSGRFVYTEGEPRVVFIAGGIGITPFRSMLVELTSSRSNVEVTLLYANRTPDIAFKSLFDALAESNPRLNVVYIVSNPTTGWTGAVGHLDAALIAHHVPDHAAALFYAAGPQPMVKAIKQSLSDLGVPPQRIKRDTFPGYDD